MRRALIRFIRNRRGASAAEFALVLPILLMFLLGIIDAGRFLWTWNEAEKATQMGARYAVVTNVVEGGLNGYSFVTSGGLKQGDPIPSSSFPGTTCKMSGGSLTCTCSAGGSCGWTTAPDQTAFNGIVATIKRFLPGVTANNVEVEYAYSGLGFAGDPDNNKPQAAPLVTVRLKGMNFSPASFALFRSSIALPSFSSTLTLEDGQGSDSN